MNIKNIKILKNIFLHIILCILKILNVYKCISKMYINVYKRKNVHKYISVYKYI